MEMTIVFTTSL